MSNKRAFSKGMYDSIPIALAYFAVAFSLGIMDISALVYYVSVIFVFVFLTIMKIKKKRWS